MTDRPILRFREPYPVPRLTGSPSAAPRPKSNGRQRQVDRFGHIFDQIETALALDDEGVEMRSDPFGIAPERALVFETAVSIADFSRVAEKVGLEVLLEFELEKDYQLPDGLISENQEFVNPTLYATMPTSDTLSQLLLLWKRFKNKEGPERGNTPWWNLFDMLIELRAWGPKDRLTTENCRRIGRASSC